MRANYKADISKALVYYFSFYRYYFHSKKW